LFVCLFVCSVVLGIWAGLGTNKIASEMGFLDCKLAGSRGGENQHFVDLVAWRCAIPRSGQSLGSVFTACASRAAFHENFDGIAN